MGVQEAANWYFTLISLSPRPLPFSPKVNLKIFKKKRKEKIMSGEEMPAEEPWQPGFIIPERGRFLAGIGREH